MRPSNTVLCVMLLTDWHVHHIIKPWAVSPPSSKPDHVLYLSIYRFCAGLRMQIEQLTCSDLVGKPRLHLYPSLEQWQVPSHFYSLFPLFSFSLSIHSTVTMRLNYNYRLSLLLCNQNSSPILSNCNIFIAPLPNNQNYCTLPLLP